jgi:hypothetical protein
VGGQDRLFRESVRVPGRPSTVAWANRHVRLALEMAAQEAAERRALEGELALLEQAWREAEEIAAIADSLLMPRWIEEYVQRHSLSS